MIGNAQGVGKFFSTLDDLTMYIDRSKFLQIKTPMFTPFRFYPAVAVPQGRYILFDRNIAQANLWGSAIAPVLGGLIDDWDFPEWLITPNRQMPPDRLFLAEYMGLLWRGASINAVAPFVRRSASFMEDKLTVTNYANFIDFRPNQKDINMRVPLDQIGDLYSITPRAVVGAAAPGAAVYFDNVERTRADMHAGLYPFFNDEINVPGMFFDQNTVIDIQLEVNIGIGAAEMLDQIQMLVVFTGWFYRPL